jgi:maltooligosyltrehalose synthase
LEQLQSTVVFTFVSIFSMVNPIGMAALFLEICERHRRYRDYTRHELTEALREAIIAFPVYRTYVQPDAGEAGPDDAAVIHQALEAAEKNRPDLDPTLMQVHAGLSALRNLIRETQPSESDSSC